MIMVDTQQGCTTVDSMYVYANLPINETLQLCTDSLLSVSPGSMIINGHIRMSLAIPHRYKGSVTRLLPMHLDNISV